VLIPCFAKRDGAFRMHAIASVANETEMTETAEQMLLDVNMADKRHMIASSLSRGDKRRLEMAMCLVQQPKLLLLDEPTAGMARADTNSTIELLARIKTSGLTIVIIEHDMHVVFSLADRITVLAGGRVIAQGAPDEIKGNPKVVEAYLGEEQV